MKIIANRGGLFSTNCYLIADELSRDAVLFDAPNDTVDVLLDEAVKQQWNLIGLWLTHGHIDHIADHVQVTTRFPQARVLIHKLDEPKLQAGKPPFPLPLQCQGRKADGYLEDAQELAIGSIQVNVIHTPGHSPGHVGFHLPKQNILIGGDLIIMGVVGRTDLPDASYPQLQQSIRKVMALGPQTRLLPGHGESSTLAEELASNEYVRKAVGYG